MAIVRANLRAVNGSPLNGTGQVSRKYPRLVGTDSYVPDEVTISITGGNFQVTLAEGIHRFEIYETGSTIPALFFEAYVPDTSATLELLSLFRPYGYEEPEKAAKPWDDSVNSLIFAYQGALVGQVPSKNANGGYTFISPGGGVGGSAIWGGIGGNLYDQPDLAAALAGKENAGVAASLISSHVAEVNPHSQYATDIDLASGLAGKADTVHGHSIGDVSGLPAALDNKYSIGSLTPADIPGLDASKTISGTFDAARIPSLPASQITSGVFSVARIPNLGGYTAVNTTGNGFLQLPAQSPNPATPPANNLRLFRDSVGLAWIQPDGFTRSLQVPSITGNRAWSFPDTSGEILIREANPRIAAIESGFAAAANGAVPTKQGSAIIYAVPSGGGVGSFTVATLPASGTNGQMVWVSDCITTIGTGDLCFWDGVQWRTRSDNIVPTTDLLTYFRRLNTIGANWVRSPRTFYYLDEYFANGGELVWATGQSGGSQGWGTFTGLYGSYTINTGATASGWFVRSMQAGSHPAPTSGISYFAARGRVSAVATQADDYIVRFGVSTSSTTNNNTSIGIEFIADVNGGGLIGTLGANANPNWLLRGVNSGTPQLLNSGVPVTTNDALFEFLSSSTNAQGYINGNLVGTLTTVPTASYGTRFFIQKAAGTQNRFFTIEWSAFGHRFNTDQIR